MLLRGLKEHTSNLTAIVTVGDDGGSSGRLRRELGVLPPGDVRNCIAALAEAEPLMTRLFQYRFNEGSGLEGHSFGNLFIVAMSGDHRQLRRGGARDQPRPRRPRPHPALDAVPRHACTPAPRTTR